MRALQVLGLLASTAWVLVSGQNNTNQCTTTYKADAMPGGTFQPYEYLNPVVGKLTTRFFVTIVNLTPHRFKLDGVDAKKMEGFDFGDVPPGRARQNPVNFRDFLWPLDDDGQARYTVEGAGKTFVVHASSRRRDDPRRVTFDLGGLGLGSREYVFPGGRTSVTLVITGSRAYGFRASLSHGPGNWMRQIYDVIKDRPIRHLVMPGTHDAGMSTISNKLISIGSSQNTQNQALNIYDQLRAGSRWFDLRIGTVHPVNERDPNKHEGFWVMHINNEMADIAVGNTGESLDQVIDEINRFTRENPGEIIFFAIRYLVGRYRIPDRGPIMWTESVVNQFFSKLRGITNRCPNLDTSTGFQNHKASYYMDRNGGNGCVVLLLNGRLPDNVPKESPQDGIYSFSRIGVRDHWSNKMHAADMAPHQVRVWREVTRGGKDDFGQLLISQWLVTPDPVAATAYTLENFAIEPTNPSLYWYGVNGMDPKHWPNVILVDYIGVVKEDQWGWDQLSAELYTLALGLNLYMVSENCDIQKGAPPLIAKRGSTELPLLTAAQSNSTADKTKQGTVSRGLNRPRYPPQLSRRYQPRR
ncbi:hypothetical protein VTJ04DRAFT_139 [Mycothermus thermophilus]|uniref:uncharacterized protein n=1 Tax=Humicola insolens TaxID=85995 RepID=UPI0037428476